MFYELMDTASANLVGDYETEDAALEAVRSATAEFGASIWNDVALARIDELDEITVLAFGQELVERAKQAAVFTHP